jgi:hypothetical protein
VAAFVCVAGAVLAWLRPWADCLLRAHVTITTDAGGVAVQRTATWFFRSASDQPPHLRLAFDLTSLADAGSRGPTNSLSRSPPNSKAMIGRNSFHLAAGVSAATRRPAGGPSGPAPTG